MPNKGSSSFQNRKVVPDEGVLASSVLMKCVCVCVCYLLAQPSPITKLHA